MLSLPFIDDLPSQADLSGCRSSGPTPRDEAYLQLDERGRVSVEIQTLYGGDGTPIEVARHRTLRFDLPDGVDRDHIFGLPVVGLLGQIHLDHTVEWNGHNFVGRFTDTADAAMLELADTLAALPVCDLQVWDAADWLFADSTLAYVLDLYGLTITSTDADLAAVAATIHDNADKDRVAIRGGPDAIAAAIRDEIASASSLDTHQD